VTSAGPTATTPVPTDVASPAICRPDACGPWNATPPSVRVRLIDGASAGLAVDWETVLDGSLLGSRRIGDHLHVVTQSLLKLPDGVRGYPSFDDVSARGSQQRWNQAIDAQIEANARLIPATELTTWLAPLAAGTSTPMSTPPTPAECASFARIDAPSRLGWLHVTTIDLATRGISRQTALADASAIYMSARSLVLSTPKWNHDGGGVETYLHRFVPEAAGRLGYHGSGRIEGTVINDYAIDESAQGVIRVAASTTMPSSLQPYTYLATLEPAPAPDGMRALGRTSPIAPGERLQSARFLGDRAYLVTFRQIDPFFVYDLSDPARPTPLGELKIPGFSTYLQPVGASHVLGIGYDGGGWPQRIKASLFDVTDPTRPLEQSTLLLGDSYTGSDALWDPHAFTWYSPAVPIGSLPWGGSEGTMAIPVRSYASFAYGTPAASGIRVVSVRPSAGASALSLNGTLSMDDLMASSDSRWGGWGAGDARRAVFVGGTVYGVAAGAVRAATVATPATPVATIAIP
jgi:hypothetical protein